MSLLLDIDNYLLIKYFKTIPQVLFCILQLLTIMKATNIPFPKVFFEVRIPVPPPEIRAINQKNIILLSQIVAL